MSLIFLVIILFARNRRSIQVREKTKQRTEENAIHYEEVRSKILELNDYGEFLKKEMDQKHKELLFLYQMISEKEKQVRQMSGKIAVQSETNSVADQISPELKQAVNWSDQQAQENSQSASDFGQIKHQILELYRAKKSNSEIAKQLGVGIGEVDLVIGLYK